MAISLNRLGALILSINRLDLPKFSERELVRGKDMIKTVYTLNIQNSKIYQIFQELLVILTQRSPVAKQITLVGQEQPELSQPGNGILTFDFTLKRFQASENTRKYFDAFPREGARVYNDANISIPDVTPTALTFNSERFDPFSIHSTVTNPSRITINRNGRYNVGGCVQFAVLASGVRQLYVRLNGTTYIVGTSNNPDVGGAEPVIMSVACDYEFVSGDYVELVVYQDSGGPLNVEVQGNFSPEFWCCRIHDQPV